MDKRPPLSAFMQKEKEEDDQEIKFLRGKPGSKGDKGDSIEGPAGQRGFRGFPGEDAKPPTTEELEAIIKPLIPKPKEGKTPSKEELTSLIKPLIPKVTDGKTPTTEELEALIGPIVEEIAPAFADSPKEIVEKINKGKDKIKASKIEGFNELEGLAKSANKNVQNVLSLGGNRQTAIKVSGTLLGRGIETLNFVGATGTVVGDGSEANITTSGGGSNLSLTTTGTSGAATYNSGTGVLNIPVYSAGSGGIGRSISAVAINTAAGAASSTDYVYIVSGTTTITLPTTVGNTNLYTIKNVGAGVVTVATTGGETIDGSATASIPVQFTSYDFIATGGNWNVV